MTVLNASDLALLATICSEEKIAALLSPHPAPALVMDINELVTAAINTWLPFLPPPSQPRLVREQEPPISRYMQGTILLCRVDGLHTRIMDAVRQRHDAHMIHNDLQSLLGNVMTAIHDRGGSIINASTAIWTIFFDATIVGPSHAAQACAAAMTLAQQVTALGLSFRAGIHAGQLLFIDVGTIEQAHVIFTGQSAQRVALALEHAAQGNIVITDEVRNGLANARLTDAGTGRWTLIDFQQPQYPSQSMARRWRPEPPSVASIQYDLRRLRIIQSYAPGAMLWHLGMPVLQSGTMMAVQCIGLHKLIEALEPIAILYNDTTLAPSIIQTYVLSIRALIQQAGGALLTVLPLSAGDMFLVIFPHLNTEGETALRAIQAALALPEGLAKLQRDIKDMLMRWIRQQRDQPNLRGLLRVVETGLRCRIGIASGMLWSGTLQIQERQWVFFGGEPIRQTLALAQLAKDASVLIPDQMRPLIAHQADLQPLPSAWLPGYQHPQSVYRAVQIRHPSQPPTLPPNAPLIGRDTELATITATTIQALNDPHSFGGVIAVIGEPGTGKTRLIEEVVLEATLTNPFLDVTVEACLAGEQATPYAPLRRLLSREIQTTVGTDPATVSQYLAELFPDAVPLVPLLSDMIGVTLATTDIIESLSSEQQRDRLLELIVGLLLRLATPEKPRIVILDDLHWADPSTVTCIKLVIERLRGTALVVVLPYRPLPAEQEPWRSCSWVHTIELGTLAQPDSTTLLTTLLQGEPPSEIVPLLATIQGTPFFLEEVVRYLIDAQILHRTTTGGWDLTIQPPFPAQFIPTTVEGLILARLRRLPRATQRVIEIASVIGRRFTRDLIELVLHDIPLTQALTDLMGQSLIVRVPADQPTFAFKHALIQHVAYSSLPDDVRQNYHHQVADAMIQHDPGVIDQSPAVLGQHYLAAGAPDRAYPYLQQAADLAREQFANIEAIQLYEHVQHIGPWATNLNGSPFIQEHALMLFHLGQVLTVVGQIHRARSVLQEAVALSDQLPNMARNEAIAIYRALMTTFERQQRYQDAQGVIQNARRILRPTNTIEHLMLDADEAWLEQQQGQLPHALQLLTAAHAQVVALNEPKLHATIARRLGGIAFRQQRHADAYHLMQEAFAADQSSGDRNGMAGSASNLGILARIRGQQREAEDYLEMAITLYQEIGDTAGVMRASINYGNLLLETGQLERAYALFETAYQHASQLGDLLHRGIARVNQGETLLYQGQISAAWHRIWQGLAWYRQLHGHKEERAEAFDLLARIAFQRGAHEKARRLMLLGHKYNQGTENTVDFHLRGLQVLFDTAQGWADQQAEEALAAHPSAQHGRERGLLLLILAQLQRQRGQREQANRTLDQAQAIFNEAETPVNLRVFLPTPRP